MCVPLIHGALLLFVLSSALSHAQGHDSRGREFWVSFLENHGSGGALERSSLRLYAACDRPTTLRLRYHRTEIEHVLQIDTANRPIEIDVRDLFGDLVELSGGEFVSNKSIIVTSDDEITLYGVNVRRMSSDAFLALPADVLTRRYIVLAYQNGIIEPNQTGLSIIDMPSQFAVIATEDGTLVRITPTAPIQGRGNGAFTVGLNRGQVYFAQATLDGQWDLSGTVIDATKPVAVYAGVRRTSIPAHVGMFRDHLVEQMPPVEVWGRDAIVTPHFDIAPLSQEVAVVRVVAATDATEWSINGVQQPALMRARAVEVPLSGPMHIVADRPILVGQFEHSVNASDPTARTFELGDPFMLLVPPTEQFDTSYAFQSIPHSEFLRHFINVIIPIDGAATIRLDGAPINAPIVPIPGTRYGYLQHELSPGAHLIRADSAFGMSAYGFGRANSYGYAGGMMYRRFQHDFEPPEVTRTTVCGRVTGVFIDDRITDSGIDSCYADVPSDNVRVVIEPFVRAADSVRFTAELVNRFFDGLAVVRAVDSSGRSHTSLIPIAGFTVHAARATDDRALRLDTLPMINGARSCTTFDIVNNGRFEQLVTSLSFDPPLPWLTSDVALPLRLAPGARHNIQLCAASVIDTIVDVRVVVGGACDERPVAVATISSIIDTLPPRLSSSHSSCEASMLLRFEELGRSSSGIAAFAIESLTNCVVEEITPDSIAVSTSAVECRVRTIDPRRDAFISGSITDAAGNTYRFADTLAGFTCAVVDRADDTLSLERGRDYLIESMTVGSRGCDSVEIVNYGTRTLRIASAHLDGNTALSVPPSQFPLTIAPGSRRKLLVCIDASNSGTLDDTLTLLDECGRFERLALRGFVNTLVATGADHCNNALSVQAIGASKRTFIVAPVPNPAGGPSASIDIGLHAGSNVSLELFDAAGAPAATVMRNERLAAGIHRIVIDVSALESGRYYVRLRANGGDYVETLAIVR